jgi:hypothetical protein
MAKQYVDFLNGSDSALVAKTTTIKTGISAISKANPCQVTLNSHGFSTGMFVHLASVGGMSQVNNITHQITVVDANNFTLDGVDSTAYATYTSGGQATPACSRSNPMVVSSIGHGFGAGQIVTPTSLAGTGFTTLNGLNYKVKTVLTADTFELMNLDGSNFDSSGFGGHCTNAGTWTQWRKIAIQSVTKANPAVVNAKGHGYNNGDLVIPEVSGMTEINEKAYTVANKTTDTFELSGVDSSAYGTFTAGTVTRPFKTINDLTTYYSSSLEGRFYAGDEVKIAKTFVRDSSIQVGSGDIVFQRNQQVVTTTVDLRSVLSVGNYIGLTSATVEGWDIGTYADRPPVYYKIAGITASTITLDAPYGGISATVSSVNRLRSGTEIVSAGIAGTTAITTNTNGVLYEGGYDFIHNTAIARTNGETAIKPVTSTGDIYQWSFSGVADTIRYIGSFESARGIRPVGTNNIVEYCYANTRLYYGFQADSSSAITRYCSGVGNTANLAPFYTNSNARFDYCYSISRSNGAYTLTTNGGVNNCKAECGTGFVVNSATRLDNCIADTCTLSTGFQLGSNTTLIGCTSNACITGMQTLTTTISINIQNCTLSNNTSNAIVLQQNFQTNIFGCSFSSNNNDINQDQYTHGLKVWDCDTTTPVNYFLSRVLNGDTIDVRDCSIDAPSIAKAYQIVAGASYNRPQYTLENSFGLPDGSYYANGSYVKDTSVYRTAGYSMKLQNSSTIASIVSPQKMLSYGVNSGVGRTISYWLKRDSGAWAGTITPQLRLGGKVIKVGSDITSLTASWVQYSISATGGEIDHNGELALEFIYNANNVAIWLDDPAIT